MTNQNKIYDPGWFSNDFDNFRMKEFGHKAIQPSSAGELLLIKSGNVKLNFLGSVKTYHLNDGMIVYIKPRNRGINMQTITPDFNAISIGLNPLKSNDPLGTLCQGRICTITPSNPAWSRFRNAMANYDKEQLHRAILNFGSFQEEEELLSDALTIIHESGGNVKIKEVYQTLGISKSKLEHSFLNAIDMTPKEYCRIIRIKEFIKRQEASDDQSLTHTTYECGYYDQSHVIKDFRYFMDSTPTQFFKTAV